MTLDDLFRKDLCLYFQLLGKKPIYQLKEELSFLDPYLMTNSVSRLEGVSYFCGADYNKLKEHHIARSYSKLDHSLACAIMIWTYTKNRCQTILALLHDIGTPTFAHAIDYGLGDVARQESSERHIVTVIDKDKTLQELLYLDGIDYQTITLEQYPLIESTRPKLCVDRLDGIFALNLFWLGTKDYNELNKMYRDLIVCHNEEGEEEFGFLTEEAAKNCYEWNDAANQKMDLPGDKIALSLLGDIVLYGLERHVYTKEDLYQLKEEDIIKKIEVSHASLMRYYWYRYTHLEKVYTSYQKPDESYYQLKLTSKKRTIDPLFVDGFDELRLTEGNEEYQRRTFHYQNEEENLYSYIPFAPIDPDVSVKKMLLKK